MFLPNARTKILTLIYRLLITVFTAIQILKACTLLPFFANCCDILVSRYKEELTPILRYCVVH